MKSGLGKEWVPGKQAFAITAFAILIAFFGAGFAKEVLSECLRVVEKKF